MRRLLNPFRSSSKAKTPTEPSTSSASAESAKRASGTPQGLRVVAEGINPIVDIVAVHGLNGHRDKTWTASNGVNWLRDLLPQDLPNARIMTWGYDANTHSGSRVSCQYLYDHARSLVADLCLKRQLTKVRNKRDA
ncbi:hypothetical protein K469DRAFT_718263 [Zopfia rhizophila CBS 207.26]|uniref:DUF676 domain-containing protein n=1 Tax=Zopfia rhizophila CBS 207.26 TaxID=1314779 RepID=A0A6A6DG21_9PEZI|nr:hypothetical protein K469DRAFT_718263 [Zopfia rhizophila CBS 207.26]